MKYLSSMQSSAFLCLVLTSMALVVSGCIATKKESSPEQAIQQVQIQHNAVLEELREELVKQKQQTARLQMNLLEKHAELNRLIVMNESLVRDFVRNQATLRSRGDKVETVRLLAELETLINTVKESKLTGNQKDLLRRAEQYQAESKIELDNGHVDGASFLADQALKLVQRIQLARSTEGKQGDNLIVGFLAQLPMKLLATSNVRKGPSKQDKVMFVLGAGEIVSASGYKGEWVKIQTKEQKIGWVHYSLLGGSRE
jgi:SH3 domain-containing protein